MAQRTVTVLVCDLCDRPGSETHTLVVDGKGMVELEACEECWQDTPVSTLLASGRKKRKPRQPKSA